jgi:hypothetical protein
MIILRIIVWQESKNCERMRVCPEVTVANRTITLKMSVDEGMFVFDSYAYRL